MSSGVSNEQAVLGGGVAVITGAGSGIGMGIAKRCGAIGMTVLVTDIDKGSAERVATEIERADGKAEAIELDVSKPEALDALAEDVFARYGAVRLLVNNAGIETLGLIWEIPTPRWDATLDVNIHGVVHGVRAFVPHMLKAGEEAWIANLSSVGAFGQMPTQTAYIMSKHAIQAFTECLHLELEMVKAPIHASVVVPGMVKTAIFDADRSEGEPESAARYRATMAHMMAQYGMEMDEGCARIVAGIAANRFWIDTQPEMTADIVAGRIAYLQGREAPMLNEQTRQILEG